MILTFFLSGVSGSCFGLASLFFLKFWRVSRDRLFFHLCTAFFLLSLERVVSLLTYLSLQTNDAALELARVWTYLLRLIAFGLIIYGVVEKNRSIDRR